MTTSSRLSGFYNLPLDDRLKAISQQVDLTSDELASLSGSGLDRSSADHMIENVIGLYSLPIGIATNFKINGRDVLIPMVIEEPSVVAGASLAARLVREGGGFVTSSDEPIMIAQMQILDCVNPHQARLALLAQKQKLIDFANTTDPVIIKLGGGARDIEVRLIDSPVGTMVVLHILYDCRDAMGANTVNTAAEALRPMVEEITGGRVGLKILSNLADHRKARSTAKIPVEALAFDNFDGELVRDRIIEAWAFAASDPYRAATHNKGIMNGIDAVVIATGNDWRAIEAGAHSYAAQSGKYTSLSQWGKDSEGNLIGTLEMPMAVGIVGGATKVHPTARAALKIMGIQSARELAEAIVSVGLAQNLAAIRALATEGIQRGHMGLHARQLAIAAGASGDEIDRISAQMVKEKQVRLDRAEALVKEIKSYLPGKEIGHG
jgi:hydroxymethylglutaryl-CoA reductase